MKRGAAMRTIRWTAILGTLVMAAGFSAGQAAQSGKSATTSDDDLKIMALNSMRGGDPVVVVPQIEKLLAGNSSNDVKKRALSILAQEGTPQAQAALGRVARGQSNPALQAEAIRQLGVSGGGEARKTLAEIYGNSTDENIKKMILRSFMVSEDKEHLLGVAKGEKDADMRGEAVRLLGNMGDTNALMELYRTETSNDVKAQVIRGLMNAGAIEPLSQIAQSDSSPEMRAAAVRQLGVMGGEKSGAALSAMYSKEKDPAVRKEILRALFIQENAKALITVARGETDQDLRVYAVRQLSLMKSKEAQDYMMEILNK
jgi:HEAT repeat protein